MTERQFIDAVLERLFVNGFNCLNLPLLSMHVQMEWKRAADCPNVDSFAEKCVQLPGVAYQPQYMGEPPSLTAGACERWLAVHEAGHAIISLDAGFHLLGVRFYGDKGFPGEAATEEIEWKTSKDEDLFRSAIRVDVAGNMAQLLSPGCKEPIGGRLSELYKDRSNGTRPTDFISADARAAKLTIVLGQWDGKAPIPLANWDARRDILAQAEAEAERVLKERMEPLHRLAEQLLLGPLTGTAVREIVGGGEKAIGTLR